MLLCNMFFGKLFINVLIEQLYRIPNGDGLYLCYDRKATFTGKTNLHTPSLEVT